MIKEAHLRDRILDWNGIRPSKQDLKDDYPLCYVPFDLTESEAFEISKARSKPGAIPPSPVSENPVIAMVTNNGRSHSAGFSLEPLVSEGVIHYQLPIDLEEAVRKDNVEILIDCTRHLDCWPVEQFRRRLAPIQISGFGYGGSSGSNFFDYFLTDRMLTPKNFECYFTEQLIFLDSYHPVEKISVPKITKEDFGLNSYYTIYGHFGALYKLSPSIFEEWMKILRASANSLLWILAESSEARDNIYFEAHKRGVGKDKIFFAEKVDARTHLERLSVLDYALDCPRLGGGSTILDALSVGVEVKTIQGDSFSSKSGESIISSRFMNGKTWARHVVEQVISAIPKRTSSSR